ncbi:hypothetical protein RJ640_030181 [Escallonia rubra]|uniref:Zinc finger PHD-type domain-containing protein n=1 Tax=Escallonia rubra TaxID=112253 RepID=A0AA88UC52_9ASTE|nr:hypothetical protein RJ640_030181 [Escallonia rubra]
MDLICASLMERKIDHPSHIHPLTPVRRRAMLLCDACGEEHEGLWYHCYTCGLFWIHRDCAALRSTIQRSDHKHPLTLSYSLPSQYTKFDPLCDICRKRLRRFSWVYYCGKCRYFTHVKCASSKIVPPMSIHPPEIEDHDSDRLYLPPDDIKSINAIEFLLRRLGLGENERATKLNHFSHDHPLILFDVQTEESCRLYCNGFAFGCEICQFYLDVTCGSLPSTIKHEAHKDHLLHLKKPQRDCRCAACHRWIDFDQLSFGCDTCDFKIHTICSLFPRTFRHRYDEHPLILTYSPVEDREVDEYYCEICEEELNPRQWFYHCVGCDQSMHTHCALYHRLASLKQCYLLIAVFSRYYA